MKDLDEFSTSITWHGKDPTVTRQCVDCRGGGGDGWMTHKGECPQVRLPQDVQDELQRQFRGFDRVRARAAAEARTAVIG